MRVALVHPFHWADVRRGGERYVVDLAGYLVSRGHEVTVMVGGQPSVVVEDGIRVRRVRNHVPVRLAARGTSASDTFGVAVLPALRERFDVVHAMVPTAAMAARLARQRVLFTALGHPTPDQFTGRPGELRLARAGMRAAHQVAAFSDASSAAVTAMFGRPCITLPLGVRCADFPVRTGAAGPVRLLFAGTPAEPRKGVTPLFAALPQVLDVHPDTRLLLPGEPWSWDGASDRVRAAVDVVGVVPMAEMAARYRAATVSVLPAEQEALGISLVESLASGTPVVGVRDAGIADVVTDPAVGRLAARRDVDGLARALLQAIDLARDPATSQVCARHARHWDWERLGPLHEQAYAALLSEH